VEPGLGDDARGREERLAELRESASRPREAQYTDLKV